MKKKSDILTSRLRDPFVTSSSFVSKMTFRDLNAEGNDNEMPIISITVNNLIEYYIWENTDSHGMPENDESWHFRRRTASLAPCSCRSSNISSWGSSFLIEKKQREITIIWIICVTSIQPYQMIWKNAHTMYIKKKGNHLDSKIFLLDSSSASQAFSWKKCPCNFRWTLIF